MLQEDKQKYLSEKINEYKKIANEIISSFAPEKKIENALVEQIKKTGTTPPVGVNVQGIQQLNQSGMVGVNFNNLQPFLNLKKLTDEQTKIELQKPKTEKDEILNTIQAINNVSSLADELKKQEAIDLPSRKSAIEQLLERKEKLSEGKPSLTEDEFGELVKYSQPIPPPKETFVLGIKETIKEPKKLLDAFAKVFESVKQIEKGMIEEIGFGLVDLDKGFVGEMFKPQIAELGEKEIKTLETAGEFAGFIFKYASLEKLLTPIVGGAIGLSGNSKLINFAIRNEKSIKKLIDLSVWLSTDFANVNNFKLTDEEKLEGKTLKDKLETHLAASTALWAAFQVAGLAIRGGVKAAEQVAKLSFGTIYDTIKKITNEINIKLNEKASEKITKELNEITKARKIDEIPIIEKNVKTIKESFEVGNSFNVNNWINKIQEKNVLYGKKIKEVFLSPSKTEVGALFKEIEEKTKELTKKEISEMIAKTKEGEGNIGFIIKKNENLLKQIEKKTYSDELEKAILRFSKQSSTEDVVKSVLERYKQAIQELGNLIKSGKKVNELDDVIIKAKLSDTEIKELIDIGEKFKKTNGTFNEFVSIITGKKPNEVSVKEIKEASIFANKFQYKGAKEMYNDLLASNPDLFSMIKKEEKTREKIVKSIVNAEEKIKKTKSSNVWEYIENATKNNPDYTYADMLFDYVSSKQKITREEFDKIIKNRETFAELLASVDKDFKSKYRKSSHKMFEEWIRDGAEQIPEENLISVKEKIITKSEETATPIIDDIVNVHSIENQHKTLQNAVNNFIKIDKDKIEFSNEKLEKAFKNELETKTDLKEVVKEATKNIKEYFRRLTGEFEVDDELNKYFPLFVNDLIKIRGIPVTSNEFAYRALKNILGDLNRAEKELLRRTIVTTQSYIDSVAGKANPMEGYILKGEKITEEMIQKARQELKETITALYKLIEEKYPKVLDAIKKHAEINRAIRNEYASRGINIFIKDIGGNPLAEDIYNALADELYAFTKIKDILPEDMYFHHEVLDFTQQAFKGVWLPKSFKKPFNPYLIPKKGTYREINTDYENVMFDYLSRHKFFFEMEKAYNEIANKYNIENFVSDVKKLPRQLTNDSFKHGQYVPEELIPEEIKTKFPETKWRAFQFDKGRYFFRTTTINDSVFTRAIEEEATVNKFLEMVGERGGKPIRELLGVGRQKEVLILPEKIFKKLENIKTPNSREITALLDGFRSFNSWFKPFVTKWYGGIAWRLVNSVGDFYNLSFFHPEAFTQLFKAFSLAREIIYKNPENYSEEAKKLYEKLLSEAYLSSSFMGGEVQLSSKKIVPNLFNRISTTLDLFSSFLEITPKLASLLENLSRIEKGKMPIIRGADKYIKEMLKQGYAEEASYAFGRAVTIDYAAMPDYFRKLLTDGFAPFSFWFARMVKMHYNAFTESPQMAAYTLGRYTIPLLGVYLWNNLPQNKPIYDALPDKEKVGLAIIVGQNENGDAILFRLIRPVDIVAQIFGIDKIIPLIEKIVEGTITPEEAALQTIQNTITAPIDFAYNRLLHPFAKFFIDVSNKLKTGELRKEGFEGGAKDLLTLMATDLLPPIQKIYFTDMKTDLQNRPQEWIRSVFGKPIDIPNQFILERTIGEMFFKKAQETKEIIDKQRNDLINKIEKAIIVDNDIDKFMKLKSEFEEKYPEENIDTLLIRRPSFVEAIIKELAKRQPDDKIKSALENIYFVLQISDIWKSLPVSTRRQFLEIMSK